MQATVKVHGLSPPDVYGLHSSPVPISDGSGLDPCCSPVDGVLCLLYMHRYPILGIPSLHSIFVFSHSLLHRPSGLSNVRELAVTARHLEMEKKRNVVYSTRIQATKLFARVSSGRAISEDDFIGKSCALSLYTLHTLAKA